MAQSLALKPKPLPKIQVVSPTGWTPHRQPKPTRRRSLAPVASSKLEKFRQQPLTLEQLERSHPSVNSNRLSQRLYVDGVALPAQHVGSLAVVWREDCEGFQLYCWRMRSPLSSLLFETREYCCEAAVELGQQFSIDALVLEPSFGGLEKMDELLEVHLQREQIALCLQVA